MPEINHNRRDFLKWAASIVTGGTLLASLPGCSTGLPSFFVRAEGNTLRLPLKLYPQLKDVGGAIEVEFLEEPGDLVIVRTGSETVVALSPKCTHLGCSVRREPSFFRCPCHGSTYTLEGQVVRGPAERPLSRYDARLVGEEIVITL